MFVSSIPVNQSILDTATLEGSGIIAPNRYAVFGPAGPGHSQGAVPDPGSTPGAIRVLREDGTWVNATGTVTSVALTVPNILSVTGSPITTSGTLGVTLANQNANIVFAGPTTGGAATPAFRSLVAADIPSIDASKITTGLLPVSLGGTNASSASVARSNLSAAALGANTDITSLGAIVSLTSTAGLTLNSASSNNINLSPGSAGINILNAATSGTLALRVAGGTSANNKVQVNFYGPNAVGDLWGIGNAISTANTARLFEVYDIVSSVTRLSLDSSDGSLTIPTGDIRTANITNTNSRNITARAHDYGTTGREIRLTYYGSGTANNIFSSIPFANLGVLAFASTDNSLIYTSGSTPLILATNSLERVRITGAGKVGIGNNNPAEVLDVVGNIIASGTITGTLNASNVTTGTLPDTQLSVNVAMLTTSALFSGAVGSSGTGGSGYVQITNQSAAPATPTLAGRLFFDSTNRFSWKGTNGFVRTFDGTANTADRVYTLPDVSGSIVLDSATQTLTNKSIVATQLTGTIAAARLPVFVASGASHALGAVPDPGASAGTQRVLREDSTWRAIDTTDLTLATYAIPSTAIDWSMSNSFSKTLGANTTFTFSNTKDGQTIVVAITNTASNYTVTWPTVSWPGGATPTQTIGAKTDVYTFVKIGSTIYGSVVQNF